jgi:RNA polymerase sigma factor (sigma-70 family)
MTRGATIADRPGLHRLNGSLPSLPPELRSILEPEDAGAREAAWDTFVTQYSRLFVFLARRVMPDRDGAMDAYTYLLEQLRRDEFRVFRSYIVDPNSRFVTWIAVVARRTFVDFFRQRYGRPRGQAKAPHIQITRAARHSLLGLSGWTSELPHTIPAHGESADRTLRSAELHEALHEARSTLSVEDRLLLQLRFDEDLSAAAIASILDMPSPFHVYRRLKTVCDELRRRLTARGIEESAP